MGNGWGLESPSRRRIAYYESTPIHMPSNCV